LLRSGGPPPCPPLAEALRAIARRVCEGPLSVTLRPQGRRAHSEILRFAQDDPPDTSPLAEALRAIARRGCEGPPPISFGPYGPQDDHHHVSVCNRMEEYPETSPNAICCGKPMYRMD